MYRFHAHNNQWALFSFCFCVGEQWLGQNFSVLIKIVMMMMMMEPHCNKYFSRENKIEIKEMCDCIKIIFVGIHILVDSQTKSAISSRNIWPRTHSRSYSRTLALCNGIDMKIGNANVHGEVFRILN